MKLGGDLQKISRRGFKPSLVVIPPLSLKSMAKSSAGLALDGTGTRECYRGIGEFSMYVHRDWRGRGVGDLLLARLINEAERLGLWKLLSRIFPFNEASRALCRKHGFREVGVYEKHARVDGRWLNVVIVERLISANLKHRQFVTR
jgi:L-amino acid N-acyltransferase YncA